jgi:hypothetical protein
MSALHEFLAINSANEIVQHEHIKRAMWEKINSVGMCTKCGQPTALEEPCCPALIWYGGTLVDVSKMVGDGE